MVMANRARNTGETQRRKEKRYTLPTCMIGAANPNIEIYL